MNNTPLLIEDLKSSPNGKITNNNNIMNDTDDLKPIINKSSPPSLSNINNNNNNNNNTTNLTAERGTNYFGYLIFSQGHVWRPTPCSDIGIDGQIEFFNGSNYSIKGSKAIICGVQIKATIANKSASISFDSLNYWCKLPFPVIIVQIYFDKDQSSTQLPKCYYLTKEYLYQSMNKISTAQQSLSSSSSTFSPFSTSSSFSSSSSTNTKAFDKKNAIEFSCNSVQEYCIDYMKKNHLNFDQTNLMLSNYSKTLKKLDQFWVDTVESFFKLKPQDTLIDNGIGTGIIGNSNNDTTFESLFDFSIQDSISIENRIYLKNESIKKYGHGILSLNDIILIIQDYYVDPSQTCKYNKFQIISKWYSYYYCIVKGGSENLIHSIETELAEIIYKQIPEEVVYLEYVILEICNIIKFKNHSILDHERLDTIMEIINTKGDDINDNLKSKLLNQIDINNNNNNNVNSNGIKKEYELLLKENKDLQINLEIANNTIQELKSNIIPDQEININELLEFELSISGNNNK